MSPLTDIESFCKSLTDFKEKEVVFVFFFLRSVIDRCYRSSGLIPAGV